MVGLGKQGVAVVNALVSDEALAGGEFWCIDGDGKMLERSLAGADRALVVGEQGLLPSQLDAIVSKPDENAAFESRQIRGMLPSQAHKFQGLTFIVGSAAASAGVTAAALQVARGAAANGRVVVCALSRPLSFEGPRRRAQADRLVADLGGDEGSPGADLVAVVDQDVLMEMPGSQALTVDSASAICETALAEVVLSALRAASAPEVLKVSRGTLMWCRHQDPDRLEVPEPLRRVLRKDGLAAIGKGTSSCPVPGGLAGLSLELTAQLVGDAVVAASRSPFLSGPLPAATGALVCLALPAAEERVFEGGVLRVRPRAGAEDARLLSKVAVQAGANAARTVLPGLEDVAVCAAPRPWSSEPPAGAPGDPPDLHVEASVVLIYDPAGAAGAAAAAASGRGKTDKTMWSALSALAGGGSGGDATSAAPGALSPGAREAQAPADQPSPWVRVSVPAPTAGGGGGRPRAKAQPPAAAIRPSPSVTSPRPAPAPEEAAPAVAPPAAPAAPAPAAPAPARARAADGPLSRGAAAAPAPPAEVAAPAAPDGPAGSSAAAGEAQAPVDAGALGSDFWDDGFWEDELEEVPEEELGAALGLPPGAAAFRKQKRGEAAGGEAGGKKGGLLGFISGKGKKRGGRGAVLTAKERAARALEGDRRARWSRGEESE